jgi:hypothetical protein
MQTYNRWTGDCVVCAHDLPGHNTADINRTLSFDCALTYIHAMMTAFSGTREEPTPWFTARTSVGSTVSPGKSLGVQRIAERLATAGNMCGGCDKPHYRELWRFTWTYARIPGFAVKYSPSSVWIGMCPGDERRLTELFGFMPEGFVDAYCYGCVAADDFFAGDNMACVSTENARVSAGFRPQEVSLRDVLVRMIASIKYTCERCRSIANGEIRVGWSGYSGVA